MLFPKEIKEVLPKLNNIKKMVEEIPQISSYENSSRAIQ